MPHAMTPTAAIPANIHTHQSGMMSYHRVGTLTTLSIGLMSVNVSRSTSSTLRVTVSVLKVSLPIAYLKGGSVIVPGSKAWIV